MGSLGLGKTDPYLKQLPRGRVSTRSPPMDSTESNTWPRFATICWLANFKSERELLLERCKTRFASDQLLLIGSHSGDISTARVSWMNSWFLSIVAKAPRTLSASSLNPRCSTQLHSSRIAASRAS